MLAHARDAFSNPRSGDLLGLGDRFELLSITFAEHPLEGSLRVAPRRELALGPVEEIFRGSFAGRRRGFVFELARLLAAILSIEVGDLVARDAEEPFAQGLPVFGRAVRGERVGQDGLHHVVGIRCWDARAYVRAERGNQPFVGEERLSVDHGALHIGSSWQQAKV